MSIYIFLQCISFVSSISLVCGTINVNSDYFRYLSSKFKSLSEATEALDCVARFASDFDNLLGARISPHQ